MGRPSKFNRLEALATLKGEIWTNGFELSSVKSLSEKLGITRSSFYNSFKSREDLFEELLDDYSQAINGKEIFSIKENENVLFTITKKMELICLYMVNDQDKRGCLAVSNIQDVVNKNERLDTYINTFFSMNVEHFVKVLNIAISRGELNPCDTRIKAIALQNLMVGISEMSKIFRKESELWAAIKETLKGLELYGEH
ncbi:MAG: TetR/AcrR family transcriptional repressor of nem operon [Chitinophagales bacterium]|jgi:TetR/AcrR family transcriptional repressor of nem operon